MRIKALLTSILLASTTIAGVASATRTSVTIAAGARELSVTYRPAPPEPGARADAPELDGNANVNYGFQVAAKGTVQPYTMATTRMSRASPRRVAMMNDAAQEVR